MPPTAVPTVLLDQLDTLRSASFALISSLYEAASVVPDGACVRGAASTLQDVANVLGRVEAQLTVSLTSARPS